MRTKARAPAVGHIRCPNPVHKTEVTAVIRQKNNANKTLYVYCGGSATEEGCGFFNVNRKAGQEWILELGTLWGPEGAPASVPRWIRENDAWGPKPSEKAKREAAGEGDPVPAPVPTPLPPAAPDGGPAPEAGPPGDASDLAPERHRRKPARDKGYKLPFED